MKAIKSNIKNVTILNITVAVASLITSDLAAAPVGTAFTYEGRLNQAGAPAGGLYDFRFSLWDAVTGGTPVGVPLTNTATGVTNGLFTVVLDFGAVFDGNARWLELGVRTNGSGSFASLTPRQELMPSPYSITAGNVSGAIAAVQLTGTIQPANIGAGTFTGTNAFSGVVTATNVNNMLKGTFIGSGAGLTGVPGSALAPNPTFVGTVTAGGDLAGIRLKIGSGHSLNGNFNSIAGGINSTIESNTSNSTIAGGDGHTIHAGAVGTFIGGGIGNQMTGIYSTIAGGYGGAIVNSAAYGALGGGYNNGVGGMAATIPGGSQNSAAGDYSFAAGRRAKADFPGAFVWADSTASDFASTAPNQFLIRAGGGVGINKTNPVTALDVNGTITASSFSGYAGGLTSLNATQLTGTISAANVGPGTITSPMLAAGSVTTATIADGAVGVNELVTVISGLRSATFTNPVPFQNEFGISVAPVGTDKVLVGGDYGAAPLHSAAAYLFSTNDSFLATAQGFGGRENWFGFALTGVGVDKFLIGDYWNGFATLFDTNGTVIATFIGYNPYGSDPIFHVKPFFGYSLAAVGMDKVIIGAYNVPYQWDAPTNSLPEAGAAFLYSTSGTGIAVFLNPSPTNSDGFGYAVAGVGTDKVLISTATTVSYLFKTDCTLLATFPNHGDAVAAVGTDKVYIGNHQAAYLYNTNGTLLTTFPGLHANRSVAVLSTNMICDGATVYSLDGTELATLPGGSSVAALGTDKIIIGYTNTSAVLYNLKPYIPGLVCAGVVDQSITTASLTPGSVTSNQLAAGSVTAAAIANGTIVGSNVNSASFSNVFWKVDGNVGTAPGNHFLGTTDNQALELKVNNLRALRLEPGGGIPNAIVGSANNSVAGGVSAATISGGNANRIGTNSSGASIAGGDNNIITMEPFEYSPGMPYFYPSDHATVGGGSANYVGASSGATIAGGVSNTVDSSPGFPLGLRTGGDLSAIGGGSHNYVGAAKNTTIAGGAGNSINLGCDFGNIGGGEGNVIEVYSGHGFVPVGKWCNIGGGKNNIALNTGPGSFNGANDMIAGTISGGSGNSLSASYATIPGGEFNSAGGVLSFAAGYRAKALNDGAFVWADSTEADFSSAAPNQFLIRASGGIGINTTNTPAGGLAINGNTHLNDHDIYLRSYLYPGGDVSHGLGWYDYPDRPFITNPPGFRIDGPVLYGFRGGALGSTWFYYTNNLVALRWDHNGIVEIDPLERNTGSVTSSALRFGGDLGGEGIASQRTGGSRTNGLDFYTAGTNRLSILNNGNVGIGTNTPAYPLHLGSGAYCSAAGVWTSVSDRSAKEQFAAIEPREVLARVSALPVMQWKYKVEPDGVKHVGPTAQDFHAAFGLGESDRAIGAVDESGVALAAIQGLNQKLEEKNAEIQQLKTRLEKLERLLGTKIGGDQ